MPFRGATPTILRIGLIGRFGSLSSVLEADAAELASISGVGEYASVFLRLVGDTARKAAKADPRQTPRLNTPAAAAAFAMDLLRAERYEKRICRKP